MMSFLINQDELICYIIKLTRTDPSRSKQYPMPFVMRETVVSEVKKMIDLGVIEPSDTVFRVNRYYNYSGNWVWSSDGQQMFCFGDFALISI